METITSVTNAHGGGRGKTSSDIRYFLTSSEAEGLALASAVTDHWAIENSLHWVLDVGFREDDSRLRDRNAAANLSVIRKIVINLVKAVIQPLRQNPKFIVCDDPEVVRDLASEGFPLIWDGLSEELQDGIRELFLGGVMLVVGHMLVHHGP